MAMLFPRLFLRPSYSWSLVSRTARRGYAIGHGSATYSSIIRSPSPHTSPCQQFQLFSAATDSAVDESGTEKSANDELDTEEEEEFSLDDLSTLTPGIPGSFFVVQQYEMPNRFDMDGFDPEEKERLDLSPVNISLPVALMMIDPEEYPSFSKARKVCRKGNVLVHRGSLSDESFDLERCIIGRVGDRIYPGDVIGKQVRMGTGSYPIMSYKQPFDLPVVYEDDYFAIVNKPAGIVVHAHKQAGFGTMTIRCCLPLVLKPPQVGTFSVLRRPQPVHRLDRPTSGLLLIAKTKPSMQNLGKQFENRIIKKTYTAIVNGIPFEPQVGAVSSQAAFEMGVDVEPDSDDTWQLIDFALEEREATTLWRSQRFGKSIKAEEETLTVVELKPKSGRYHQLRRHMAWVCKTPLVGDDTYDGGGDAMGLREQGLFLCSNRVVLEHPYFNTEHGRKIWGSMSDEERFVSGMVFVGDDDKIMVAASIDLPAKFEKFLTHEKEHAEKFE
jgi:23S rRNA pseudouridine1911/1915/1917 synthase